MGPTGWVNAWFEGPGTQYALDNNWDWPTSVDPFGIWEQYANSTTSLPSSPIVVMETGIQIIAQIIQYSTGTSDLSLFPRRPLHRVQTISLWVTTPCSTTMTTTSACSHKQASGYTTNLASGGTGYPQQQMGGFIYPHAFQEFLDTMGIDFNVGVFEGYGASNPITTRLMDFSQEMALRNTPLYLKFSMTTTTTEQHHREAHQLTTILPATFRHT